MKKTKKHERREPQETYICLNPSCLKSFQASALQAHTAYCSSACKQKAYRLRKKVAAMGQWLQPAQAN